MWELSTSLTKRQPRQARCGASSAKNCSAGCNTIVTFQAGFYLYIRRNASLTNLQADGSDHLHFIMFSTSPSKSAFPPMPMEPSSQRPPRTLRKLKSAHVLSSHANASSVASPRPLPPLRSTAMSHRELPPLSNHPPPLPHSSTAHSRTRSNSDAAAFGLSTNPQAPRSHAAAKRVVTAGLNGNAKNTTLDALLRDGPRHGNIKEGLECMRYQVLSNGVGSDHDGMVGRFRHPTSILTNDALVVPPNIYLADSPLRPAHPDGRLPRPGPSRTITCVRQDPERHLPHASHGSAVSKEGQRSQFDSLTECRRLDAARSEREGGEVDQEPRIERRHGGW